MRMNVLFAGLVSTFLSISAFAGNPQGQEANYQLDKNPSRTSSIIKKGVLNLKGGAFTPKPGTDGTYAIDFTYNLRVIFAGVIKGQKTLDVPAHFFSPDYMDALRKNGSADEGVFKVQYLGVEDVDTLDGKHYPACDKLRIYDVKAGFLPAIKQQIADALASATPKPEDGPINPKTFDNVNIIIHANNQVPVLGGVSIDASATVRGIDVKAGFDYVAPTARLASH